MDVHSICHTEYSRLVERTCLQFKESDTCGSGCRRSHRGPHTCQDIVSGSSGGHSKIAQTGRWRQWKFTYSSGGWKSKSEGMADLGSSEALFLGLQMSAFSPCPHVVFPVCVCVPWCLFLSFKDASPIRLGPHFF